MSIAVVDYGSGNLRSAAKALERAAREAGDARPVLVTDQAEVVAAAGHIVLPGVGAFADCRAGLLAVPGMVEALGEAVIAKGRPFLGVCVGMQLMATEGLEHGHHPGLDWLSGRVEALTPDDPSLKIPHMGWNQLSFTGSDHPVLAEIAGWSDPHAYFVHGYHLVAADPAHCLATTDYGGPVTAIVGRDNLIGTQFHPEKSQALGLTLLGQFLRWRP